MLQILKRVVQFQIYGNINDKMQELNSIMIKGTRRSQSHQGMQILQTLVSCNFDQFGVRSISLSEDCGLGDSQLCKITRVLRLAVPVFCFAEDVVMNSAVVLLTSGNKCYANKYSMIGDFGYVSKSNGLKDICQRWGIERKYITSGENKVRLNQFEDLKPQDVKWIQNLLYQREFEMKKEIVRQRQEKFEYLKVQPQQIEEMWNKSIMSAQEASQIGQNNQRLVDGLSTLDSIVEERYHGLQIASPMNSGFLNSYVGSQDPMAVNYN